MFYVGRELAFAAKGDPDIHHRNDDMSQNNDDDEEQRDVEVNGSYGQNTRFRNELLAKDSLQSTKLPTELPVEEDQL